MSKRGRHKSATNDLNRSIRWLESLSIVKKVILGFTESCRHKYAPGHLRYQMDVQGGMRVIGYSGNGVTDLFLRVEPKDIEEVKKKISERYEK
jgi:hypothetical protein